MKQHVCSRCKRYWEHALVVCKLPNARESICPNCRSVSRDGAEHWEYLDDFDGWVMEVREEAGV